MTMQWIAGITTNGSDAPSFTNIPQNFTHLQIRVFNRGTRIGNPAGDLSYIRFNDDYGTNYTAHWLLGTGSSVTTGFNNSLSFMYMGDNTTSDGSTLANVFAAQIWDILDYSNPNKFKTVRMIAGWDANGSGYTALVSGLWRNTAAITSIPNMGVANSLPAAGSRYDLYGITTSAVTGA